MPRQVVNTQRLLDMNPEFAKALAKGEKWALDHMETCRSLNAGESEASRRKFDGKRRKWCGASCPSKKGCVVCTLEEDHSQSVGEILRKIPGYGSWDD